MNAHAKPAHVEALGGDDILDAADVALSEGIALADGAILEWAGWIRFSRDRVCTAANPLRVLSTYMAYSFGWSNPVWYFSATTRI